MSQFTCCFAWFILLIFLKQDLIWGFFQAWPWLLNNGTVPSCSLNVYEKIHNISYPMSLWYAAYLVTDHYFPNISKSHFRDVRIRLIIQIPKNNYYPNFHLLSTVLFFMVRSKRKLSNFLQVLVFKPIDQRFKPTRRLRATYLLFSVMMSDWQTYPWAEQTVQNGGKRFGRLNQ